MLESVKMACRKSTVAFDDEFLELIEEAKEDLKSAGIIEADNEDNPLIRKAIKLYCRLNFGQPDDYDKLKLAYDELKAQLQMSDGYTEWGGGDGQV